MTSKKLKGIAPPLGPDDISIKAMIDAMVFFHVPLAQTNFLNTRDAEGPYDRILLKEDRLQAYYNPHKFLPTLPQIAFAAGIDPATIAKALVAAEAQDTEAAACVAFRKVVPYEMIAPGIRRLIELFEVSYPLLNHDETAD